MAQLRGRPLLATQLDEPLFVGRGRELETLVGCLRTGVNVLILGPAGSGKTSLMHQAEYRLRDATEAPIFLDCSTAITAFELLRLLRWRLDVPETRPSPMDLGFKVYTDFFRREMVLGDNERFLMEINALRQMQGPRIVLLDNLAPDVAQAVFGRARDELWELPITWALAGDQAKDGTYRRPPADAFWERVLRLDPLSSEESVEVVRRRLGNQLSDEVLGAIALESHGRPRGIISLAQAAMTDPDHVSWVVSAAAERQRLVSSLPDSLRAVYALVEAEGRVSPSDPDVQRASQMSRALLDRRLRDLESRGVLRSFLDAPNGGGRPRKIYGINEVFGRVS